MRTKRTVVALPLFLLLHIFSINNAIGDYVDYHFNLECIEKSSTAKITPYAKWNTDIFSNAPQECTFTNGTRILARMGLGPTYPYGAGGANPDKFISVWVNKVKIISKRKFECIPDLGCTLEIEVNKDGIKYCNYNINGAIAARKPLGCESVSQHTLSKKIDIIEFPDTDNPPPKPGSTQTLYQSDVSLCDKIKNSTIQESHGDISWSVKPPAESIYKIKSEWSPYAYAGHFRIYQFDINNDGHIDDVIALHSRTRYRDGDIYFIFEEGKLPDFIPPDGVEQLTQSAKTILPYAWWQNPPIDIKEGSFELKSKFDVWWDKTKSPRFEPRYLYMWPFIYNNDTYFLTGSREGHLNHWFTVLKPEGNTVRELCIFQRVKPNV